MKFYHLQVRLKQKDYLWLANERKKQDRSLASIIRRALALYKQDIKVVK